eukprot:SAG11_NODE_14814_length_598_cov_17.446894_1_plen_22_part_10
MGGRALTSASGVGGCGAAFTAS